MTDGDQYFFFTERKNGVIQIKNFVLQLNTNQIIFNKEQRKFLFRHLHEKFY